jgi:hypothetical protein
MKHLVIACLVIASTFSTFAQTSVTPFDASKDLLNGIVYSLPKNQINITITARCTIEKPGPFYQYAERYLATKEIITTNNENWEIEKINIHTSAIPDPNRTFQIAIDNKGIANNITYYHNNIIAGINISSDQTDKSDESDISASTQLSTLNTQLTFDYTVLNEDALVATSIPKMAEMVARQIYHIRESRTALLSADLDQMPDGEALKQMIARLDQNEAELVAFFVGKTISYSVTKTYSITPDDNITDYVIARISTTEGLTEAGNVIGEPIYLNIKGTYYNAPFMDPKQEKAPKGFYYNVPGEALITIDYEDIHYTTTLSIAQFGYTTSLNATLTNNKTAKITFNPELGTILKIEK